MQRILENRRRRLTESFSESIASVELPVFTEIVSELSKEVSHVEQKNVLESVPEAKEST
jgi:hypothetical protein